MKQDIHKDIARPVLFVDAGTGDKFLIESTVNTTETDTFEGSEYPVYKVEISSASHPFYTGNEKVMDTAGRVDKFKRRMAAASGSTKKKVEATAEDTKETATEVTENVKEKAEEVYEDTEETVTEAAEEVKEFVGDAIETVSDTVGNIVDKVTDVASGDKEEKKED